MSTRILLVEDEVLIRETLQDLLHSSGYLVRSASNGRDALSMVPLYRPHLVISDIMMPEVDGIAFLSLLKSDSNWNNIPVILLTAKREFEDRITGLETGADAYVAKPFSFQELSLIIKNLLELRGNIQMATVQSEPQETSGEIVFIHQLADYISQKIKEPLTLPMMADHFGLSDSGFKQKIKRTTGKTFREYVREFRLKKSHEYLITQRYNISEVAYMTGFKSIAHFSDAFKRYFGVSPSNLLT